MGDDPSGLFEQLEQLDRAEPLDAEEDLILRMESVSKVRSSRSQRKSREKRRSLANSGSPTKGITKRQRPQRGRGMQVDAARST